MQGVIMHETHNAHDEHDEMQHDARMNATNKTNHTTNIGIAGSLLERRSRGVTRCQPAGGRGTPKSIKTIHNTHALIISNT